MFTIRRKRKGKKVRRKKTRRLKQKGGKIITFEEFMELDSKFILPLHEITRMDDKTEEIIVLFENLTDSEETVKQLIDNDEIDSPGVSISELYDYAINAATNNYFKKVAKLINEKCGFNDKTMIIEVLKNAWDSNLEFSYEKGHDDASRLEKFKERFIKIQIIDECKKLIISNNGVPFPDKYIPKRRKQYIQIKNYKLLGGQNVGLGQLNTHLNTIGYSLTTKNEDNESWVIIEMNKRKRSSSSSGSRSKKV
jgi:hypothetical protein